MLIYGAGMAGLLAANMLRRWGPMIHEAQPSLPDNHGAVLRFRSRAVEDATGLKLREVPVQKGVVWDGMVLNGSEATLDMFNQYSYKATGEIMGRSVMRLEPSTRYIAPNNFLANLAEAPGCLIQLNRRVTADDIIRHREENGPIISTLPMPVLMMMLGWEDMPDFRYRTIWSVQRTIHWPRTDVFQTLYFPELHRPYYRATITGSRLIIEYAEEPSSVDVDIRAVASFFGLPDDATFHLSETDKEVHRQEYGKLLPIDDQVRRRFIVRMTEDFGIYSLGRFATWRQLLLDDVVKDVRSIERFIEDRSGYTRAQAR